MRRVGSEVVVTAVGRVVVRLVGAAVVHGRRKGVGAQRAGLTSGRGLHSCREACCRDGRVVVVLSRVVVLLVLRVVVPQRGRGVVGGGVLLQLNEGRLVAAGTRIRGGGAAVRRALVVIHLATGRVGHGRGRRTAPAPSPVRAAEVREV